MKSNQHPFGLNDRACAFTRPSPHLRSLLRTVVFVSFALSAPLALSNDQGTTNDGTRFQVQGKLHRVSISADKRYTLEASARYAPEVRSSDGRFSLKAVNVPNGGCSSGVEGIFSDGFET